MRHVVLSFLLLLVAAGAASADVAADGGIFVRIGCGDAAALMGMKKPGCIVQVLDKRGGLVVHVVDDSVQWAGEPQYPSPWLVQALDRDLTRALKARAMLRQQGVRNGVTVLTWDGKRLPYADNTVNRLYVRAPAGLTEQAILRVLAPKGTALIWTRRGLRRLTKPWPADIDEWTHYLRKPDNNAVARDTRVAPPRHIQWMAGPRWARSHDHLSSFSAAVSAAGRLFYIIDEGPAASVKAPAEWKLVARDAFNGTLLWKKPIEQWESHLRPFRSGPAELPRRMVVDGDRLYLTLGYGEPVTALNAATGEVVRTYKGTENTHEILFEQGKLYLVVSAATAEPGTTGEVIRKFDRWRGGYDEYITQYPPKHLRAVDAETGRLLWKKQDAESRDVLPLTLTVADGRVFFHNDKNVIALKAETGDVLWRAARPVTRHRYAWSAPTVVVSDGVLISADRAADKPVDTGNADTSKLEWRVSSNHLLEGGEMIAFSAETGKKLWSAPCWEGFNFPAEVLVVEGKVFSGEFAWGRQPGIRNVYDIRTGKVVQTRRPDKEKYTLGFGHHRCYRNKATSKYIIQGRSGVEFVDVREDRAVADHWVRGACQYGILPCNGLVYAPQHSCACYITAKLSGLIALSGAPSQMPPAASERMDKGPAYAAAGGSRPAAGRPESTDWPTYRRDAARSGASPALVSHKLSPRWSTPLPGTLTAVSVCGGKLFVARKDAHTVCALDAESGKTVWSFTAGGRVDSPPTIHGGCAYFGSADGWVYCLRAADGELAWRSRAAPADRQIVSFEQLESVWPVHGTVLVCPGPASHPGPVAYAAAGRCSYADGGVYLVGFDAHTGKRVVRRRISHRDPKTGHEPQGTIRGVNMPGAMPDVLTTDGESLFMRHTRMDREGKDLPGDIPHLFSSVGFLDADWWHRTYWQVGTMMGTGYGGWTSTGNARISGRLLVTAGQRVFGFGRKGYAVTGSHQGFQGQYRLFAADARLVAPTPAEKKASRRGRGRTKVNYRWSQPSDIQVRAMALAGQVLWIAGPVDIRDLTAASPAGAVDLRAVAAESGKTLAQYKLPAAPVLDSIAVTPGRLYLTTVDGRVLCYEGK